jgi:hypothetical protein
MASSLPWANVAGMSPGLLPLFVPCDRLALDDRDARSSCNAEVGASGGALVADSRSARLAGISRHTAEWLRCRSTSRCL